MFLSNIGAEGERDRVTQLERQRERCASRTLEQRERELYSKEGREHKPVKHWSIGRESYTAKKGRE